jgi:hypothetical protein
MGQAASCRPQDRGGHLEKVTLWTEDTMESVGSSVCHCPPAFAALHSEMILLQTFPQGGREPKRRKNKEYGSLKAGGASAMNLSPRA